MRPRCGESASAAFGASFSDCGYAGVELGGGGLGDVGAATDSAQLGVDRPVRAAGFAGPRADQAVKVLAQFGRPTVFGRRLRLVRRCVRVTAGCRGSTGRLCLLGLALPQEFGDFGRVHEAGQTQEPQLLRIKRTTDHALSQLEGC